MATYSVRAPDGKTVTLQGPDGASQEDIIAQAQRLYKPTAAPKGNEKVRQSYEKARQAIIGKITDPVKQRHALTRFDSDPRMKSVRELAGLAPVATREQQIRKMARESVDRNRDFAENPGSAGMIASAQRGTFGIPERLAAAGRYYLGGGSEGIKSYGEELDMVRAETDELIRRGNTGGNLFGALFAGGLGGSAAGKAIASGAGRLAAAGAPTLARAGNVLQSLTQLKKGQRLANTGRIALAGAAGGGAQAAGEGSDVLEGAAVGAVAAPAFAGGAKLIQAGGRALRQATRPFSKSVPKAIQEVITEAPDAVVSRQKALSEQTGANVPVVAALRDQDFRAVTDKVLKRSPDATEIAQGHTGKYVRGFMDRMLKHVNNAGRAAADGGADNTNIGDLAQLRRDTADDLMRPIQDRTVDLTQLPLDDLERQMTRQIGGRIAGLAPRINEALKDLSPDDLGDMGLDASDIANARKLMTDWGLGTPVQATVKEMDSLRRALNAAGKSAQTSNPANAMAFRNAAKAVRDFTEGEVPAYGQVVDTYAAQSRMMEGFKTAAAGHRITDIEDDILRGNLRTPEGRIGLKAGELFRQREAVTGRTTGAIAAARDFASEGKLTRPASLEPGAAQPGTITENLGDQSAAGLARASQGETQVLNRMLDTDKLNALAKNEEGALTPMDIARLASISGAMTETKIRIVSGILKAMVGKLPTPISKKVANNLADMLFSQDEAATQKAINALKHMGISDRMTASLMQNALPNNIAIGMMAGGRGAPDDGAISSDTDVSVEADLAGLEAPEEPQADLELNADEGSPYEQDLQHIYDTEDPELLDLIGRVEAQESGGDQSAVSSAGAIGVMQVMPDTAPEAAALAGLPWDEEAYRKDATYNRILGIAYLSEMLRRYDGDVELALAAYNAGPGRADEYAAGRGNLPAETQDYVARIAG